MTSVELECTHFVGSTDSCSLLYSYVVILKRSGVNFRLHLRQDFTGFNDSYEMCCLLMKWVEYDVQWVRACSLQQHINTYRFDYFLFKAYMLLRSSTSEFSKRIYPVAVRELSGQLFLMAAQYLYFEGNVVKSTPMRWAENSLLVRNYFILHVIRMCIQWCGGALGYPDPYPEPWDIPSLGM